MEAAVKRVFLFLAVMPIILFGETKHHASVIDTAHKLQWQDSVASEEFFDIWKNAKSYCSALHLDGHNDWRLPTKKELLLLSHDKQLKNRFQHLRERVYWSGDDDPEDDLSAITVFIGNGFVSTDDKCNDNGMICVRFYDPDEGPK